jgi:hypothetical protein
MAASEIWTYQDIVEHLLDMFDNGRAGRPLRMARRASIEALRDLSASHRWSCYDSVRVFATEAAYSTGTITYDHTGGTSERLVTLAGGTFPLTAGYGRIIINGVHYSIDRYIDATSITLNAAENPGADISTGVAYTWYRNSYPLPDGFVEMGELWDIADQAMVPVILADQQHRESIYWYDTPDEPWQACVRNDGEMINTLSIVFGPPPSTAKSYSLSYHRSPRQLLTDKYSTGTVSVGAGSTSCAIATGAFTQSHVGCIIRFGTAAVEPDNIFGGLGDTDNPFTSQRTIVAVATAGTSCTLDSILPAAVTTVKFVVSDPIDIDNVSMLSAYQRMAEAAYTRLSKREQKDRAERESLAMMAFQLAKERDNRVPARGPVYYDPFTRTHVTDDES